MLLHNFFFVVTIAQKWQKVCNNTHAQEGALLIGLAVTRKSPEKQTEMTDMKTNFVIYILECFNILLVNRLMVSLYLDTSLLILGNSMISCFF